VGDLIVGQFALGVGDFGLNGALGIAGGKADGINLVQRKRDVEH